MPAPVLFTRLQLPTITDNLHRTMIGCYMNIIYVIYFFYFFIVGTGWISLCWVPLFVKRNKKHFFTVGTRNAIMQHRDLLRTTSPLIKIFFILASLIQNSTRAYFKEINYINYIVWANSVYRECGFRIIILRDFLITRCDTQFSLNKLSVFRIF